MSCTTCNGLWAPCSVWPDYNTPIAARTGLCVTTFDLVFSSQEPLDGSRPHVNLRSVHWRWTVKLKGSLAEMAISQYELTEPAQQTAALHRIRAVRRKIVLQVIALGLAALAIPLYLIFSQLDQELAQLDQELVTLQERLIAVSTPSPQVQALTAQLDQMNSLYNALSAVAPATGVQWPAVVTAIDRYDQQRITIVSLTQNENRLVLDGRATDNAVVVSYMQDLTASPLFADVEIESMTLTEAAAATAPVVGEALEKRQPVQFRLALVIKQENL